MYHTARPPEQREEDKYDPWLHDVRVGKHLVNYCPECGAKAIFVAMSHPSGEWEEWRCDSCGWHWIGI